MILLSKNGVNSVFEIAGKNSGKTELTPFFIRLKSDQV